jgi:hypothetical protein
MSSFDWTHPTVQLVIERVTRVNRKVTYEDCQASKTLRDVALYYASNYEGNFQYMLNMRGIADNFDKLSDAQSAAVINCLMNDYRYQQDQARKLIERRTQVRPMPEAELPNLPAEIAANRASEAVTPTCANGTYTIVLDEAGDYRTIRLTDAPETMNKRQGTQIAAYLSGSDNEGDYTGFAFVSAGKIGMWKKFHSDTKLSKALVTLLQADKERQADLGQAYALESGNCWRCGRKLTVPASINRGLGPICAEKLGF